MALVHGLHEAVAIALHGSNISFSSAALHSDVVDCPLSVGVEVDVLGKDVVPNPFDQVIHPQVLEVGHEVLASIPVVGHGPAWSRGLEAVLLTDLRTETRDVTEGQERVYLLWVLIVLLEGAPTPSGYPS